MNWLKQLFCKHDWLYKHVHRSRSDYDQHFVCKYCGKEKDIND